MDAPIREEPQPLETVLLAAPAPPAPPPPRVWTVFLALAVYLVGSLVAGITVAAVAYIAAVDQLGAAPPPEQASPAFASPAVLLAGVLAQLAIAGGITMAAAWFSPERLGARLALGRVALGPGALALASLGLVLSGGALQELARVLGVPVTGSLAEFERVVRGLSPGALPIALVVGGVLAPVAEELFFRGYVQSRLCRRWGTWPGISVTALFFALAHFDPLHSASALAAGLFLGWLAARTGSTAPGIVVHAVNNLLAIATTWALADHAPSRAAGAALLGIHLIGGAALIAWLARRLPCADVTRGGAERAAEDENAAPLGG